jgi:hypothetical protein
MDTGRFFVTLLKKVKLVSGEAKTLFFLAKPIKDMFDRSIQEHLTAVINSGLKAFSKSNKDCKVLYRVTQEGVHYLAPHMTKRKIVTDLVDFIGRS